MTVSERLAWPGFNALWKRRASAIVKGLYVRATLEKQVHHLFQPLLNGDVDECAVLTVEVSQVDKFFQPLGFAIQNLDELVDHAALKQVPGLVPRSRVHHCLEDVGLLVVGNRAESIEPPVTDVIWVRTAIQEQLAHAQVPGPSGRADWRLASRIAGTSPSRLRPPRSL